MNTPIKDNARILADQQAFMEAYGRASQALATIEGVVDVGLGQKETHGEYRDDIAIVVFVREKRAEEELPPELRIPPTFEGYRTDVRVVRRAGLDACDNTATYDTIQGGIQIMARLDPATGQFFASTLGCIVRRRGDTGRENIYLLSNKHALFALGAGARDNIYHPFAPSPDRKRFQPPGDSNTLGPTQAPAFLGNVPFTIAGQPGPTDFFIDCAIARIDIDSKCFGSTCTKDVINCAPESIIDLQVNGANTISDVRSIINQPSALGERVFKVGRTTGKTAGIIRLINAPVELPSDPTTPGSAPITGLNTIEIDFDTSAGATVNCKGNARFTEKGDSGAVVVDQQGRVIGLHCVGAPPGSPNTFPSNACHILPVLDNLGICIPTTTGNSRGSCRATDGTGTAPAATASTELEDASWGLAAERVEGTLLRPAPQPQPIAVSDAEREHLLRLRDEFRRTPKARELHDVFGEVRREIGYLVRNSRRVKLAWYRGQGPAFLAHTLNHLRGESEAVPLEVNGVSRAELLTRMARVLAEHGSNPLRAAIERYQDELMPILSSAATVQESVALFRESEAAAAGAAPDPYRTGELAAAVRERDDQ